MARKKNKKCIDLTMVTGKKQKNNADLAISSLIKTFNKVKDTVSPVLSPADADALATQSKKHPLQLSLHSSLPPSASALSPRLVTLLSDEQMDLFLAAEPFEEDRHVWLRDPRGLEEIPTLYTAYRVGKLVRALFESTPYRTHREKSLVEPLRNGPLGFMYVGYFVLLSIPLPSHPSFFKSSILPLPEKAISMNFHRLWD